VDLKYLESFEIRCWRRMEKISWTDRVRNDDFLNYPKRHTPLASFLLPLVMQPFLAIKTLETENTIARRN
jgi:hypothetical protein